MRRKSVTFNLPSDSSDDEPLAKKVALTRKKLKTDESSSESDIDDYLQPADKLDLDSPFFSLPKINKTPGESVSESASAEAAPSTSTSSFRQLYEYTDYTRKIEEARRHVEEYNARRKLDEKEVDVTNLLTIGETKNAILDDLGVSLDSFESHSDSEIEGWEEVEDMQKDKNVAIPENDLEIIVEMPGCVKKKKGADLFAAIKRRINHIRKKNQLLIHKVHLLCWIAYGNYVNCVINSKNILTAALSLPPSKLYLPPDRTDLRHLKNIVKWYRNDIINVDMAGDESKNLEELLEAQIAKREVYNIKMLVYIFVGILRSLGFRCRLVLSLQVEPLRPPDTELCSLKTKPEASKSSSKHTAINQENTKENAESSRSGIKRLSSSEGVKNEALIGREAQKPRASSLGASEPSCSYHLRSNGPSCSELSSLKSKPKATKWSPKGAKNEATKKDDLNLEIEKRRSKSTFGSETSGGSESRKPRALSLGNIEQKFYHLRSRKNLKTIPQLDGGNDSTSDDEVFVETAKIKKLNRNEPKRNLGKRVRSRHTKSDSEDDFEPRSPFSRINPNSPRVILKRLKPTPMIETPPQEKRDDGSDANIKRKKRKSDEFIPPPAIKKKMRKEKRDSQEDNRSKNEGVDCWVEVFLETENKWICIDLAKGRVNCINELYTRATSPVSYILAWNNDNFIKDITSRYSQQFNTTTRRLRVNSKWWEATLNFFQGPKTLQDKKEDEELERNQLEQPLPKVLKEYKNHPLYVLKRHLLKYEAIYPPDSPTLGFVRGEAVYSRQCVFILRPRAIWLRQAKVVKPGEKAYKIVKGRPRWDKLSRSIVTDPEEEVFGPWQIQDYEPPTAENGIVPRNAYGNVELFKPCMLPKKTVHLRLPGLGRIAKRMNIDCASAFIGFHHSNTEGWLQAAYDGYVVCEEYADVLVAAWELDREESEKKEREKIEKRVYTNWKKLIKGLLIRERLKAKYAFGDTRSSSI